jgi:hypothetical protein
MVGAELKYVLLPEINHDELDSEENHYHLD